jgi:glycosyl transferase family 2
MELVLSAHHFASIGGAETYLLTVAEHLQRLGHGVTVHALELGEMAEEAEGRGIQVARSESALPERCDAIVSQSAATSPLLAARYRDVPQVFVSHGTGYDFMLPPQLPNLVSKVVALNDRVAARMRAGAAPYEVVRLRQPIDLDRFNPRAPTRTTPRVVLLLGNYMRGSRRGALEEVCSELGLQVRQIGRHGGRSHPHPELEIADADVVVGYGRSALEGMASGKAVYVYDHSGGDGWVTADTYQALEANGFAGSATDGVVDRDRLRRDLLAYEPEMGLVNRELARAHHDALNHAAALVPVLRAADPPEAPADADAMREIARLARVQWAVEGRSAIFRLEAEMLRERADEADRVAEERARHVADAEARLAELIQTRRYKLGSALASPLDSVRSRLRRRGRARVLALVSFRDEARFVPGLFENLAAQVDGVVALDDGSTDGTADLLREQPMVVDLIEVPPGAQDELEDGRNHRALTEAAWRHSADWLLGLDADERLERDFRPRAEEEIARAERDRQAALWVWFRELWDAPDRVRVDGIWGGKRKACLFRSDRGHHFDDRRVHANWASWPPAGDDYPQADLNIYHLRMIDPEDRRRRLMRYRRIDPDNVWQEMGYDYLLDETGLELRPLEPGREYVPLGR